MQNTFIFIYPLIGLFVGKQINKRVGRQGLVLLNGLLYFILALKYGQSLYSFYYSSLFTLLLIMAYIDLEHMIIDNKIHLFILLIGIGLASFSPLALLARIIGALSVSLILLLTTLLTKGGIGGGDIKLMAVSGFALGFRSIFFAFIIGLFSSSIAGLIIVRARKENLKMEIPFGPFLGLGIILAILLS